MHERSEVERVKQSEQLFQPTELIFPSENEIDEFAAFRVLELVTRKPDAVLILPTGNTPKGMYRIIAEESGYGRNVDFSRVTVFNLDEYWRMGRGDNRNFQQYMKQHFYNYVNVPKDNRYIPDSQYEYPSGEVIRIQDRLRVFKKKGIDLAVLGIGPNGHIGFCEPGTPHDSETSFVELTEDTRWANARDFRNYKNEPLSRAVKRVPKHAITLGLGEDGIRAAENILLLANGSSKAEILRRAFREPPTTDVPASVLQFHPRVVVAVDSKAGSELAMDYTEPYHLPRQCDIVRLSQ